MGRTWPAPKTANGPHLGRRDIMRSLESCSCKSWSHRSLGVPGSLVASLLGPRPLRFVAVGGSLALACPPMGGRFPSSLHPKGPGTPGTLRTASALKHGGRDRKARGLSESGSHSPRRRVKLLHPFLLANSPAVPLTVANGGCLVRRKALLSFSLLTMDDKQNIIGLSELLDEVNRDLDEFRKKHPNDYSVKNITLWWELERERLLARHSTEGVVKKLRRVQSLKRMLLLFTAGWLTMIVIQAAMRLLFN